MFIGGNWKLNGDKASLVKLADEINSLTQDLDSTTIAVFPPFVYLPEIIAQLNASHINVGAQNQAGFASGAYTGEIAASMLKDIGCEYVLLGHSERRHVYAESDEMINQKMHFLCLLRCCHFTSTNCPHRFIGNYSAANFFFA